MNLEETYYEDQSQLIDNYDPYDWIKASYYCLKAIDEVF